MSVDARVRELVLRIQETGDTPDEICRDCPELLAEVRERWAAVRAFDAGLNALFPSRSDSRAAGADARQAPAPEFPGYAIERLLGSGGMGVVYKAREVASGRLVALKVVHPHLRELPGFVERLRREAEIGERVVQENVVRTFGLAGGASCSGGRQGLVTEYVEGQTLRALLGEMGRVPEQLCRHVGHEIAKGLAAIHAAGAVHRDLKPENVLITADHVVKVMDLGAARILDVADGLSQPGAFVGSVRYAAPEQLRCRGDIDSRADLYALGLVLYELATGWHAFDSKELPREARAGVRGVARRASELQPQLSTFFDELLAWLLQDDPDARPADSAGVAAILDSAEESAWWRRRAEVLQRARGDASHRRRVSCETGMYGRAEDLAFLLSRCDLARDGTGQVVLLEGEAGIGKSRLLDEFIAALRDRQVDLVFGAYAPGGAATASSAFSSAFRDHFGAQHVGEELCRCLADSPALVPAFAALLRGEPTPSGAEPLTKDTLQTAFVRTTQALAAERLTIVVIDDLHFAPAEGRALFAALAVALVGHRALLVGTARPTLDAAWAADLGRLPHATRRKLRRLELGEVKELLLENLGNRHAAEDLAPMILSKTQGSPYFVFEVLRELRSSGRLRRGADAAWEATRPIREIPCPPSIREFLRARFDALSPEDRETLQVAACCGPEFDPLLVGEVLGLGRLPLLRRLGTLETAHQLVRSAGRRFAFDHHLLHEVLYSQMSDLHRESFHARIADALAARAGAASADPAALDGALCVELTEHHLRGAQGDRALRYLDAALEHIERQWKSESAAALLQLALSVPGLVTGARRGELLLRRANHFDLLGRLADEQRALGEAMSLADGAPDPTLRARVRLALGFCFCRVSRNDEALRLFEEAIALFAGLGDRRGGASATRGVGNVLFNLGRFAEARARQERCCDLAREAGDVRSEALAHGSLGNIVDALGDNDRARDELELCIVLSRRSGDRWTEVQANANLGNILCIAGRLEEARTHYEAHRAFCLEFGDRAGEAHALGNLANVMSELGRLAEACSLNERSILLARETGSRRVEAAASTNLGNTLTILGRAREGLLHVERGRDIARAIAFRHFEAAATAFVGEALEQLGRTDDALAQYERSLADSRNMGYVFGTANALILIGISLADGGRADEAARRLDEAVAVAHAGGILNFRILAAAERAVLAGGDVREVAALFADGSSRMDVQGTMRVRWRLWQATGDPAHLAEAKRLLDFVVEHAPQHCRASTVDGYRLHREIAAAACRRPELGPISRID